MDDATYRNETEELQDEEENGCAAVVIDNGSALIKAGFGGDEAPRSVFENIVGRVRFPELFVGPPPRPSAGGESFVGDECQGRQGVLAPRWPMEAGIVTKWDAMEEVWRHTFYMLRVDPMEQPVLMTEAPLNPKTNREKMVEICLGKFSAPAVYVVSAAALSLQHACGGAPCKSGLVVDSGASVTHVVPIYKGYVLPHAVRRISIGGRDLDNYILKLLCELGYSFTGATVDHLLGRDIKEALGHVASQSVVAEPTREDRDRTAANGDARMARRFEYDLPDGQVIQVGDVSWRCVEPLFEPSLLGMEGGGLPTHVYEAATACDAELHSAMLRGVVLAGGNMMFPGMAVRMEQELRALGAGGLRLIAAKRRLALSALLHDRLGATGVMLLADVDADVLELLAALLVWDIGVCVAATEPYSAWKGGAAMVTCPAFSKCGENFDRHDRWLTRVEYQSRGSSAIHEKCNV
eukprot:SAG31_NODE_2527_length_5558_cov_2.684374_3_plen_465_part_00